MPIGHGAFPFEGHARIGKSVLALRAEGAENFRARALGDSVDPMPPRKASLLEMTVTVPKTDTGGLG